jgi:hypothetical protein
MQVKLKEPTLKIPNNIDIRCENKWCMLEPAAEEAVVAVLAAADTVECVGESLPQLVAESNKRMDTQNESVDAVCEELHKKEESIVGESSETEVQTKPNELLVEDSVPPAADVEKQTRKKSKEGNVTETDVKQGKKKQKTVVEDVSVEEKSKVDDGQVKDEEIVAAEGNTEAKTEVEDVTDVNNTTTTTRTPSKCKKSKSNSKKIRSGKPAQVTVDSVDLPDDKPEATSTSNKVEPDVEVVSDVPVTRRRASSKSEPADEEKLAVTVPRVLRRTLSRELVALDSRGKSVKSVVEVEAGDKSEEPESSEDVETSAKTKPVRTRSKKKTDTVAVTVEEERVNRRKVKRRSKLGEDVEERLVRSSKKWCRIKSGQVRKNYEQQLKVKKSSFKRISLKLFRSNKKHTINTGRQGVKLFTQEYFTNKENNLFIADLPFLTAEVKENPVQVIQCSTKREFGGRKLIKRKDIHVKVSLPLISLTSLNLVNIHNNNNNTIEDRVEEEQAVVAVVEEEVESHKCKVTRSMKESDVSDVNKDVQDKTNLTKTIDKIYYCEICQTYYYSSSQLKTHKLSNRHKSKEMELNNKSSEEESVAVDLDKSNEDTCEMPVLEGPFIETPPPADPFLSLDEKTLKDLQTAIGCTDEEMFVLAHLGDQHLESDILDLDVHMKQLNKTGVENGVHKFDLKRQISDALETLLNKTVVNLLPDSSSESIMFLKHILNNKLSGRLGGSSLKNQIRARFITKVNVENVKDMLPAAPAEDITNCEQSDREEWNEPDWSEDVQLTSAGSSQFLCSGEYITSTVHTAYSLTPSRVVCLYRLWHQLLLAAAGVGSPEGRTPGSRLLVRVLPQVDPEAPGGAGSEEQAQQEDVRGVQQDEGVG